MSLAAVIVETRNMDLFKIITDHLFYLPENTRLYVFTSEANRHLKELLNCELHIVEINSIDSYNKLLTSIDFWNKIQEENVLIFQTDSRLLKNGIEEFYEWDYVGASWNFFPYVGNGGLSFRKNSAMKRIINSISYTHLMNEDIYFAHGCKLLNLKLAPVNIADKFSCETKYIIGTLGYHAIEKYLTQEQVKTIQNQYDN